MAKPKANVTIINAVIRADQRAMLKQHQERHHMISLSEALRDVLDLAVANDARLAPYNSQLANLQLANP